MKSSFSCPTILTYLKCTFELHLQAIFPQSSANKKVKNLFIDLPVQRPCWLTLLVRAKIVSPPQPAAGSQTKEMGKFDGEVPSSRRLNRGIYLVKVRTSVRH